MDKLMKTIVKAIDNISQNNFTYLNNNYSWNTQTKTLLLKDKVVDLTSYESAFLDCLVSRVNENTSYEDIHYSVCYFDEYSQDAIFSIAKRLRKKTKKEFIKSSFNFGYKIESA